MDEKDINERVLESLIKCGAFDNISDNRASLMMGYEKLLDSVSMDRKKNIKGQISLFDGFQMGEETVEMEHEVNTIPKIKEFEERERLALEKEVLGMYVSGHPLGEYEKELKNNTSIDNGKINSLKEDIESYLWDKYKLCSMKMIAGDSRYFVADITCDTIIGAKFNGETYPPLLSKEVVEDALKMNEENP